MEDNGRRLYFFDAGEGVRVGSMVWTISQSPLKWSLYISASNGFINCVSFLDPNDIESTVSSKPALFFVKLRLGLIKGLSQSVLTAVRVAAFISHLAVNEGGSVLAASYEESVKVWPIPFEGKSSSVT